MANLVLTVPQVCPYQIWSCYWNDGTGGPRNFTHLIVVLPVVPPRPTSPLPSVASPTCMEEFSFWPYEAWKGVAFIGLILCPANAFGSLQKRSISFEWFEAGEKAGVLIDFLCIYFLYSSHVWTLAYAACISKPDCSVIRRGGSREGRRPCSARIDRSPELVSLQNVPYNVNVFFSL